MLASVKIARRQSELRQQLSALVAKDQPSADEVRQIETLDGEFQHNETRYRAALTTEAAERKQAGDELETREGREWSKLVSGYEVRQAIAALDEGRELSGATKEVVTELRAKNSFRGVPVPFQALERRAGETVASGVADPKVTAPAIDRIFPASVAAKMGTAIVNIGSGLYEYPVVTSSITAGWQATETGNVAGPTAYATTDRPLAPNNTLGIQVKLTRRAMKQSGEALEAAIRRDLQGTIQAELDKAVFVGSGASGQPTGIFTGAAAWSITETDISAIASFVVFRDCARRMLDNNAASALNDIRFLIRPLTWQILDTATPLSGTAETEYDRVVNRFGEGAITMTSNALPAAAAADGTNKAKHKILATVSPAGQPPIYLGLWGAVDLIRDPYSDAQAGGVRLTALVTADVTISRPAQLEVMTNVQDRA